MHTGRKRISGCSDLQNLTASNNTVERMALSGRHIAERGHVPDGHRSDLQRLAEPLHGFTDEALLPD